VQFVLGFALSAAADSPIVNDVVASSNGDNWTFSVTLSHPDSGWDHYADGWRVVDENGALLGTRILHHPHVQEQPFTRSLGNVKIPRITKYVLIETRCSQDGWSNEQYKVTLQP